MPISYVKQIHLSARWDTDAEKNIVFKHLAEMRKTFAADGYNTEITAGDNWANLVCRKLVQDGKSE